MTANIPFLNKDKSKETPSMAVIHVFSIDFETCPTSFFRLRECFNFLNFPDLQKTNACTTKSEDLTSLSNILIESTRTDIEHAPVNHKKQTTAKHTNLN